MTIVIEEDVGHRGRRDYRLSIVSHRGRADSEAGPSSSALSSTWPTRSKVVSSSGRVPPYSSALACATNACISKRRGPWDCTRMCSLEYISAFRRPHASPQSMWVRINPPPNELLRRPMIHVVAIDICSWKELPCQKSKQHSLCQWMATRKGHFAAREFDNFRHRSLGSRCVSEKDLGE